MGAAATLALLFLAMPPDGGKEAPPRGAWRQADESKADERRYDPVPLQGNLDVILKQLLLRADEDEDLAKLLDALRANPQAKGFDPKLLDQLKMAANDPWLRGDMLDLARRFQNGDFAGQDRGELWKQLEKLSRALDGQFSDPGASTIPFTMPKMLPGGADLPPPDPGMEDRLARMAKDWLKDMDQSRVGDYLRESPAWQNTLRDLERAVPTSGSGRFDWLGRVPDKLRLPDTWLPRLNDWAGRMPKVKLPNLPNWRFNPPNLGRWSPSFGGPPSFSAPSLGSISVSDNLYWALAPLLIALMAWVFYQKLGRDSAMDRSGVRRGPWPVDPARVTTRTQLVQAFDYLALLLLGDEVRTWNHVAVAKKLGEKAPRRPAAGALAQLYELARYTPGDDVLSPEAQAAARRHLVALARSPSA
jgi:hypothetical protein